MDSALFDRLTLRLGRRALAPAIAALALPALAPAVSGKKPHRKKCKPPRVRCGKRCFAVQTDPANCGACGRACAPGETCAGGVCQRPCPAGQKACSGACIPAANCCTSAECPGGTPCQQAVCLDGACRLLSKEEGVRCTTFGGLGGECRGGDCFGCLGRGSLCSDDSFCCGVNNDDIICASRFHTFSVVCADSDTRCCGRTGSTCESNCDCCAPYNCAGGKCCRTSGAACSTNGQCCSGSCASGNCA